MSALAEGWKVGGRRCSQCHKMCPLPQFQIKIYGNSRHVYTDSSSSLNCFKISYFVTRQICTLTFIAIYVFNPYFPSEVGTELQRFSELEHLLLKRFWSLKACYPVISQFIDIQYLSPF